MTVRCRARIAAVHSDKSRSLPRGGSVRSGSDGRYTTVVRQLIFDTSSAERGMSALVTRAEPPICTVSGSPVLIRSGKQITTICAVAPHGRLWFCRSVFVTLDAEVK
jgi:hypothetical protein